VVSDVDPEQLNNTRNIVCGGYARVEAAVDKSDDLGPINLRWLRFGGITFKFVRAETSLRLRLVLILEVLALPYASLDKLSWTRGFH